jgi:CO/xanthine dehydrogenase FAD-binding subunit
VSATIADGIWPLLDASGMQALDRNTIEALGVPGEILMESAGRAVVERVLARRTQCGETSGEVRIVCGGVAPTPYRATGAEKALTGKPLNTATIKAAAKAVAQGAKPLAQNRYKIPILESLVRDALKGLQS